jgi:murein DD-endopeptidase MepM/ murein hydrolase activator NlpD
MNPRPGFNITLLWLAVLGLVMLAGCQPGPTPAPTSTQPAPTPTSESMPAVSTMPSVTPSDVPTETPISLPQSTPLKTTGLCSPLEGEALSDLGSPDLLKNPFLLPSPGDDGGHFGVDFSYWARPDGTSMLGLPIYSVLDGMVAGVIENRQPYGNALIIETSLAEIDPQWQALLPIQAYDPGAPLQPASSLTCPDYDFTPDGGALSLYLLYAHMQQPAQITSGSQVACGQQIGQVGTTGNSVNHHLHLETRIGPSGIKFTSMAHYDTSATRDEMRNYCLWRLSGAFMPFDPMLLLSSTSSH